MTAPIQCCLTIDGHALLLGILAQTSGESAYKRLLRKKLARAETYSLDDFPDDAVTINSRVTFCVDAGAPRTANVVRNESCNFPVYTVSIKSLLGLGVLGLRAGGAIGLETEAGGSQRINVIRLDNQALAPFLGSPLQQVGGSFHLPQ